MEWARGNSQEIAVVYTLNTLLQRFLSASFNLKKEWEPKWSRLLPTIRRKDPELYKMYERYLLTSETLEKIAILQKILSYLKKIGGSLKRKKPSVSSPGTD